MAHHVCIRRCFKVPCGYIHRTIHTGLEVGSRFWPMMVFHIDVGRRSMMKGMSQFSCYGDTCQQCRTDFCSQSYTVTPAFHIHFGKYLGKELHAVIVIHSHELVKLLLGDFMTDDLTVYNGCHLVFSLGLRLFFRCSFSWVWSNRLNPYLIDRDFTTVATFTEPSFVLVDSCQVIAVHTHAAFCKIAQLRVNGLQVLVLLNEVLLLNCGFCLWIGNAQLAVTFGLCLVCQTAVYGLVAV